MVVRNEGQALCVAVEMERRAIRVYERALMLAADEQVTAGIREILSDEREHLRRFSFVRGFSQNLSFTDHDGVCGDDHITCLTGNGCRLAAADTGNLVTGGQGGIHGFVDIRHPDDERPAEQPQ